MAIGAANLGAPVLLTSSGVVAGGTAMARTYQGGADARVSTTETTALQGAIVGFYVNSTSAGTLILASNNGGAAGTAFTGTITPAIGWNPFPVASPNGIFATIGGTLNVTFVVIE